jgi:hypothetical protein
MASPLHPDVRGDADRIQGRRPSERQADVIRNSKVLQYQAREGPPDDME